MLIRIDDSVVSDVLEGKNWTNETIVALDLLALAQREGKHIVIAKRETLEIILDCKDLAPLSRKIYARVYNNLAQAKSYLSAVTKYVEVVDPCLVPSVISHSGKQIIRVPPSYFDDSAKIQRSIILCEHAIDVAFYIAIAKVYLVWKNQPFVQIACEAKGGGGSTTFVEYTSIQQNKNVFCLCIVDSDRSSPNDSLGSTAKKTQDDSDPDFPRTELIILNVREAENLIPNGVLVEVSRGDSNRLNTWSILEKIQASSVKEIRGFLDFKKGTSLRSLINKSSLDVKAFWQARLTSVSSINNVKVDSWCNTNWQCSDQNGSQAKTGNVGCNCFISPGFGDHILDNTVAWLKQKSPHEISKMVDQDTRQEWERLGQLIVNWCLADRSIRA